MKLKFWIFAVSCIGGVGGAQVAAARLNPEPPPSGIVVHLFGPNSVLQNVAPALADAPAGGPRTGAVQPGAAQPGAVQPGAAQPGGSQPGTATSEPGWGSVLHQMFVTGDPNSPNLPAPGKIGHQLSN